ncbi:MAG: RNA polymerase sporulation sigma factor SigH [bacterium]|nr:RNA polymerase sporulation sigma factor SigH [bacterium]
MLEPVPFLPIEQELLLLAKAGNEHAFEALLRRYEWLVRARARSFFLQGAEYEDLIQEGMIGLFKAVRDFRADGGAFRSFADLCITRQIITAVKTASRQKHIPLNSAFSLEAPRYDGNGDRTVGDTVSDQAAPLDAVFLQTAEVRAVMDVLRQRLSAFEFLALTLWLEGRPYDEIARRLGKHIKSVDNGLWRVKCKIRRLLGAGVIPRGDI